MNTLGRGLFRAGAYMVLVTFLLAITMQLDHLVSLTEGETWVIRIAGYITGTLIGLGIALHFLWFRSND